MSPVALRSPLARGLPFRGAGAFPQVVVAELVSRDADQGVARVMPGDAGWKSDGFEPHNALFVF